MRFTWSSSPGSEWLHNRASWTGFASGYRVMKIPLPPRPSNTPAGVSCESCSRRPKPHEHLPNNDNHSLECTVSSSQHPSRFRIAALPRDKLLAFVTQLLSYHYSGQQIVGYLL